MFKKVTQKVAKQMDPKGDLVPVHSISDQDHFRLLCLVRRKRKARFRPFPSYRRTEFRLHDVLLPVEEKDSVGKAHIYHPAPPCFLSVPNWELISL